MIKFAIEISKLNGILIKFNIFRFPNGITVFVQADLNLWWIPKIIRNNNSKSIGWLFVQIGYMKHKSNEKAI